MNRRIAPIACLAAALVLGGAAWVAQAAPPKKSPDLSGTWKCEGWNLGSNFDGKPDYEITVTAEAKGSDTYLIAWQLPNGTENKGVGLYDPRTKVFATGYSIAGTPGVAVYEIGDKAKSMTCVGVFAGQVGKVAQERWSR